MLFWPAPHMVISKEGMTLGEVPSHYTWGNAQGVILGKVHRDYMWGNAQRVRHSRNKHHFPEINIPPKWSLFQECSKDTTRKLLLVYSCDMPSKYTGKNDKRAKWSATPCPLLRRNSTG